MSRGRRRLPPLVKRPPPRPVSRSPKREREEESKPLAEMGLTHVQPRERKSLCFSLYNNCSVLVEDDCDKICDGGWKERPYAWNPVG
jgi:hypothetical protein